MADFQLLGPVELRVAGCAVPLGPVKQRTVLAALLVDAGRPVSLETLVDRLWDDAPPAGARGVLYSHLARIRRILAQVSAAGTAARLERQAGGYRLVVHPDRIDLHRFKHLVEQARTAGPDADGQLALMREAVGLWRGTPLADLPGSWAARVREGIEQQRLGAVLLWARAEQEQGRAGLVVDDLRELLSDRPSAEPLAAELMRALHLSGRTAEALEQYAKTRQHLADELGVEPGSQLRELHQAILRGGLDQPAPRPEPGHPGPAQLPADIAGFTGRTEQLGQLDAMVPRSGDGHRPVVVISAIAGTAGVGKTALAVRWAHRVRDRFPDGQLYVNLCGYAPRQPLRDISVLAQFLRALGVPADRVPVEPEEAAALYRSILSGKRVLIVLDNARDAAQVRLLLPGSPGCLVLITSRDRLSGLVARDGADRLTLDVLIEDEARALLTWILGACRAAAEPDAVGRLAEVCGRLPLALRIAAANLRDHPDWRIAAYVMELEQGDRLSALQVQGDDQAAVRAAFDLSYAALAPEAQRLFRLLGLVPGPDFTAAAAAALAGAEPGLAGRLLDGLACAHLLIPKGVSRFTFHDLLRRYATERAGLEDSGGERAAALGRLLRWYLNSARAGAQMLHPRILRLALPPADTVPLTLFDDRAAALAWLNAERLNLVAAVEHASEHGPHPISWLLADALRGYFGLTLTAADWLAAAQAGQAAAEADGDLRAQAAAQLSLADLNLGQARYQQAIGHHARAVELSKQAGWLEGQSAALANLGAVYGHSGQLVEAAACLTDALAISQRIKPGSLSAPRLTILGVIYYGLGQLERAATQYSQALVLHRAAGSRVGEANTLGNLGEACHALGRLDEALHHLTQALDLNQETGNRGGRNDTLRVLAEVHRDTGGYSQALELVGASLSAAREIGQRRCEAESLNTLATIRRCLAEHTQAASHHEQALLLARRTGTGVPEAAALIGLAATYQDLGDSVPALGYARQAVALTRQASYRMLEGQALGVLAAIHLGQHSHDRAITCARQALIIHQQTGHRLGEARTLVLLGQARQRSDDPGGARACFRQALTLFSDIGAAEAAGLRAELRAQRA